MESTFNQEGHVIDYLAIAAVTNGQIVQLPDGRAAQIKGDADAGEYVGAQVHGVITVPKTTGIALLVGGDAYWDISANKAHFRQESGVGDFYLGMVRADAASAATEVQIDLNKCARYEFNYGMDGQPWTAEELTGTGGAHLVLPGGADRMTLSNANEAQQLGLKGTKGLPASANPIFEAKVTRVSASNDTVDIDVGLASGTHATDFESVTAFVAVHLDGADNDIDTHSDDGTTDRAPADSTINDVDATPFEIWIDCRDDADVKFYIDGVLVDTSASKRILTAAVGTVLYPTAMIEKTAGTATAEFVVHRMRARTGNQE